MRLERIDVTNAPPPRNLDLGKRFANLTDLGDGSEIIVVVQVPMHNSKNYTYKEESGVVHQIEHDSVHLDSQVFAGPTIVVKSASTYLQITENRRLDTSDITHCQTSSGPVTNRVYVKKADGSLIVYTNGNVIA